MEKKIKITLYMIVISICMVILVASIVVSLINRTNSSLHRTPTVTTHCGKVEGKMRKTKTNEKGHKEKIYEFLNIPYAQPPIGPLRWRPPVALGTNTCWNGTLKYTDNNVQCPQTHLSSNGVVGDEDCLILDVRTPSLTGGKLPVLVHFHPGELVRGHSKLPGFHPDAEFTASVHIVTVSVNYRLNVLGFLSVEELREGESDGNYGVMDQLLALRWVRENIGNFGGDANDVTIWGGTSVYCLLSASLDEGKRLFNKVIASSGIPNIRATHTDADKAYRPIVASINCSKNKKEESKTCLRNAEAETLVHHFQELVRKKGYADQEWTFPFNNATDGVPLQIIDHSVVKYSPTELLPHLQSLKKEHKIDLLLGSMAQEPKHDLSPLNFLTWPKLDKYLKPRVTSFNISYNDLKKVYNASDVTPYYFYSVMLSDILLSCGIAQLAHNLTSYAPFKVYSYVVSQPLSPHKGRRFYPEHDYDIIPLFDFKAITASLSDFSPTQQDIALKTNIRKVFKDFIHSSQALETKSRGKTIEFRDSQSHTLSTSYHGEQCSVLRKHGFLKHTWGNRGKWDT